ncbi:diguanylate cyclase [Ramlibacter sp. H39-3-26]|uniref:sensor domain-containing diguanylate cyclase n=1 Tax=Curvibacter soli TaxID=3031331 RepID=UPI0023DAAB61|nr:diguanylate cyclase [Ramlibacter sp. H39-3-26]MDF1484692.1 diguanylate cyclase [Ramlibacter sp. H39-3-26]
MAMEEYRLTATLLDTLGIAMCVFDAQDCSVLWNQSFLRFFPEHDGHVYAGEPYGENLRRFYRSRLPPEELVNIERYVADGVQRNRTQTRPFVFQHRGRWFRVSSVPEPGGGRLRIWISLSTAEAWQYDTRTPETVLRDLQSHDAMAMLENIGEGAVVLDADQHILAANDRFVQMYGAATKETVIGMTYAELVYGLWDETGMLEQRALYEQDLTAALLDGASFAGAPFEVPLPGPRWVRVTMNHTAGGQSYAIHADISASKQHELELRAAEKHARELANRLRLETRRLEESEQRLRTTFTQSGIPSLVALPQGGLIDVNDALCALLGYPRDDLLRLGLADVMSADAAALAGTFAQDAPAQAPRFFDTEVSFIRRDGSSGAGQFFCAPVRDAAGRCQHVVGHLLDITQRKSAEKAHARVMQTLRQEALHDGLTGLRNRRSLEAELRDLTTRAGTHGLLFIDLDGFKDVNDVAGHAAGDEVLREIAELLRQAVRSGDTVARLGGDEFVVVLHHCDAAQAMAVGAKITRILAAREFPFSGQVFHVGASIGVRIFDGASTSAEDLMRDADAACYAAKRKGRGRVERHPAS